MFETECKTTLKHRKPALSALSLILCAICCFRCSESDQTGLRKEVLDNLFNTFSPEYNYTEEETVLLGHCAQVAVPGFDVWQAYKGITDCLGSADVNMNSMFRIGSATKMFTATIILQLWEEGLLDLDTPFNTYLGLDETTYPKINQYSEVTIRHLLSHRSGLSRISSTTFFDNYFYTDSITQLERMKYLFTENDPEFAPGTQYAYRNSNFNVLGLVIECVTGVTYHEILQQRICIPVGMANTRLLDYDITSNDMRIAHGYTQAFEGTDYHGSQAWAAGGLLSTVKDLSKFMQALTSGELFQKPSTFYLMVTPVDGGYYSLGMFVQRTEQGLTYGHSGAIFGYNTRLEYFPEFDATVISIMSFNGYDFMVMNWYEDFCFPVIKEIRRIRKE
jgi:D-alanyl-D-alanine carboxypeptidase